MSDLMLDTVKIQGFVERWQDGDRAAADELVSLVQLRLEHLARKMLRSFPRVRNLAETGDVLQGSLLRLLKALGAGAASVQPPLLQFGRGAPAPRIARSRSTLSWRKGREAAARRHQRQYGRRPQPACRSGGL